MVIANILMKEAEENFDVDQRSDIESDRSEIRDNRTGSEPERRENSSGTGLPHLQPNPFSLTGLPQAMIMNPASLQMLAANLQASQSSATATNPLAHLLPSSLIGRGASMSALNALQQSNLAHRLAAVPTTTPTQITPSSQPTPQTTQLSNGISQNGISDHGMLSPPMADPQLMQHYACRYGTAGMGRMNPSGHRKNATRENTAPLKKWLNEHLRNPYPTKGEKIILAIISHMTLTQVSTWFANARRRLKKENRMTWNGPDNGNDAGSNVDVEETEIDGESTHPAASNPATSSQTRYSSPSNSSGQIDSSPIARSTIPPQPTIQASPNINENVVNNNNLTNHSNAAQLQALQFAQSLQLAQSQLTNPLLSQQPFQLFGTGLPSVTTSNTSTILQQMQLQQHILQLRQNQQAVATNRERNNSASSGAIWRLADLANGESRSQDRQSDDDTPEPKRRKLEEGDDRPEE